MGFFGRLARTHRVVAYDRQGCGLFDRHRTDFSLDVEVEDACTVVDQLSPERLSIYAMSQGGPVAIAYATRRPEQVSSLVLYSTYARGADVAKDHGASLLELVRDKSGFGSRTLARLFLTDEIDDPTALDAILRLERGAVTREMAARLLEALYAWDVTDLLGSVKAPALVMHRRGDRAFEPRLGREVAAGIPAASFVLLEGNGHVPWYGDSESVLRAMADHLGDNPDELARPMKSSPRPIGHDRWTATAEDFSAQIAQRNLLHEQDDAQRGRCRIGLAQLSLPIGDLFEDHGNGLLGIQASRVDDLRRKLTTIVTSAHDEGIDLLLLPELACDLKVSALRADLEALAARTQMTIVAGSHHDVRRRRNVSTVFGPESVLWEQEKHLPSIITVEGRRIEEGIRSGPKPIVVANTRFGRVAVVICRDFLDLDLRVALRRCSPPIDIILNPAFTPVTADFQAAHFEARRSLFAYCFFCNVAEFGGSAINTPEKDRTIRTLPAGTEGLLYKDVDLLELRAEREKWAELRGRPRFIQSTR